MKEIAVQTFQYINHPYKTQDSNQLISQIISDQNFINQQI